MPWLETFLYLFFGSVVLLLTWRYVIRRHHYFKQLGLQKLSTGAVVVTGCDSGFGQLIALRLHQLGATVFAGCLSEKSCAELLKTANKMSRVAKTQSTGTLKPFICNICKDEDVTNALKLVKQSRLPLRALVNNAGISAFGWAEALSVDVYKKNMEVNFFGTVRMTHAFLPMLRRYKGRIINMGSIGAKMPSAFGSAYLATKAAMCSYSECVRQEVYRFGVPVSLIEPGFFATGLLAAGSAAGCVYSAKSAGSKRLSSTTSPTNITRVDAVLDEYPCFEQKMKQTAKPIQKMEWLNGRDCSWVVNAVVDAVVNLYPLAQYTVGYDARIIRHLLVYLPSWIVDVFQTLQDK